MGNGKRRCHNCIWYQDCVTYGDKTANCQDFSPVDESEYNEKYYDDLIRAREAADQIIVREIGE